MSQQVAVGQGAPAAGCGGAQKPQYFHQGGVKPAKGFKSLISEIANNTFNTGKNKFAAQFTQSRKNVANYLQRTSAAEGYLVAKTVHTGRQQTIELPPPIDPNNPDTTDLNIIRAEEVKTVAKLRMKLAKLLKKGYATVYDQCSKVVREAQDKGRLGQGAV
jgi:hypothetical protein